MIPTLKRRLGASGELPWRAPGGPSFETHPRSGRAGRSGPGAVPYGRPCASDTITAANNPPSTVRNGSSSITRAGLSLTRPRHAQDGTRGADMMHET